MSTAGGGRFSRLSPTGGEGRGEGVLLGSQPLTGLLNWTTALVGLLGVFCSAMVYHDTGRIFWRGARSIGRFFGTTAVLGLAVGWLAAELTRTSPGWIPAALAVVATFKLAGEHRLLRRANHDLARETFAQYRQRDDWALARSGVLMRDHLGAVTRARFFFGVAGGVVLPLLSFLPVGEPVIVAAGACLLCAVTEFAERSLFFRAVVVPKMPGTV